MSYLRHSVTICVCAVALLACGDDGPGPLREATQDDLPSLVLRDGDAGPSYRYIDRGPYADETFVPVGAAPAGQGTICINDNAQLTRDARGAKKLVDGARETVGKEEGVEILDPSGLVDGALAYHFVDDTPPCPEPVSGAAHAYIITFSRSNVLCFLAVFTSEEQGPELAVSLARKQAERIEVVLAKD